MDLLVRDKNAMLYTTTELWYLTIILITYSVGNLTENTKLNYIIFFVRYRIEYNFVFRRTIG